MAMVPLSPTLPLVGGALIALSTAGMLLGLGRVAGISGVVGGLVRGQRADRLWRIAFVGGLLVGGAVFSRIAPAVFEARAQVSWPLLIVAGFLVGVGTSLSHGCTSGHGVCGISRGSPRSIVATLVFMALGAVAAMAVGLVLGPRS